MEEYLDNDVLCLCQPIVKVGNHFWKTYFANICMKEA